MPATVTIRRHTGAAATPTKTDITAGTTRASTSDDPAPGSANPIPIPATGSKLSFWVATRLSADTSPTGTINNLRWFTDGSNNFGTGITVKGQSANAYDQASGVVGDTGDVLDTTNYTGLSAAAVDVFTFTAASPKALTGSISNPATGDFGDFMVVQMEVASTAGAGAVASESFSYRYDET